MTLFSTFGGNLTDFATINRWEAVFGDVSEVTICGNHYTDWTALEASIDWIVGHFKQPNGRTDINPIVGIPAFPAGVAGTLELAVGGSYDAHYVTIATKLLALPGATIDIRLPWEMNYTIFPWKVISGREALSAAMLRKIVTVFRGVSNRFRFHFCYGLSAWPKCNIAACYPGDSYIDVFGFDLYEKEYRTGADTPEARWALYRDSAVGLTWAATFAAAHSKPIVVHEAGAGYKGDNPYFVQQLGAWLKAHNSPAFWWNQNSGGYDGTLSKFPKMQAAMLDLLTVAATVPALVISTAALAGGTEGEAYSQSVAASGGVAPYTFAIGSGALPGGLSISSAGLISGTPSVAGSFSFSVTAADAAAATATKTLSIAIASVGVSPPPPPPPVPDDDPVEVVFDASMTIPPVSYRQVIDQQFNGKLSMKEPFTIDNPQAGYAAATKGFWQPGYMFDNNPKGETFPNESAALVNPQYPWTPAYTPFHVQGGKLTIRAERTTPIMAAQLWDDYPWQSGVLVNKGSEEVEIPYYGEMRGKMPKGRGLWPAFWLINGKDTRQLEIDIEFDGAKMREFTAALHWDPAGGGDKQHWSQQVATSFDIGADYHIWGVLVTRNRITWCVDRKPVLSVVTPSAYLDGRWYFALDLSVGGEDTYAGPPDATTPSPSYLRVDHFKVWAG